MRKKKRITEWINKLDKGRLTFSPEQFDTLGEFQEYQRSKVLNNVLIIILIAAISLGLLFMKSEFAGLPQTLFSLAVLSIIGLSINKQGQRKAASILLIIALLITAFFAMEVGWGLRDASILALPAIIILVGYLFERKHLLLSYLAISIGVGIFHWLSIIEVIHPLEVGMWDTVVSIWIINGATAVIVYTLMQYWEKNLFWMQHATEQVQEAYEKTLEGWAKALEFRDWETAGHSRRVVHLVLKFAEKNGITDEHQLKWIRQGALMHDIGKLAIPTGILQKKEPLTDEEWAKIREHPLFAKDMLSDMPFESMAIDIPLYHHEHWDGTGYPFGLKGEDIPFAARLFSIIDNWDALCSDRPYRSAWEMEEAAQYIKDNAGAKFDPDLVPPFLELVDEKNLNRDKN